MRSFFLWNNSSVFASFCKLSLYYYSTITFSDGFCCLPSYGDVIDTFPLPEVDLPAFLGALDKESAAKVGTGVPQVWSPVELKVRNWIDSKHAMKSYGKGGKCAIC